MWLRHALYTAGSVAITFETLFLGCGIYKGHTSRVFRVRIVLVSPQKRLFITKVSHIVACGLR
jgi:hypothetical protein